MRPRHANSRPIRAACAVIVAAAALAPAAAQYASEALIRPGDPVAAEMLASRGGQAGRVLAESVGRRPVLLAWWRPLHPLSEQTVAEAWAVVRERAPEAVFLPVAMLSSRQPVSLVARRAEAIGLEGVQIVEDDGTLALALGVRDLPAFALIDAGGTLRAVGGSTIYQQAPSGTSLLAALVAAVSGEPVETLGVMPARPVYRLLGQKLPDLTVHETDAATEVPLSQFLGQGKRVLLVYWLGTCPHCRESLPKLFDWYRQARPDDLVVIDLARGDSPPLRQSAASLVRPYPWIHLLDLDTSAGKALLVTETPTAFLIEPDGEISGIQVGGSIEWSRWLGSAR